MHSSYYIRPYHPKSSHQTCSHRSYLTLLLNTISSNLTRITIPSYLIQHLNNKPTNRSSQTHTQNLLSINNESQLNTLSFIWFFLWPYNKQRKIIPYVSISTNIIKEERWLQDLGRVSGRFCVFVYGCDRIKDWMKHFVLFIS